jgi:hypothetical protein
VDINNALKNHTAFRRSRAGADEHIAINKIDELISGLPSFLPTLRWISIFLRTAAGEDWSEQTARTVLKRMMSMYLKQAPTDGPMLINAVTILMDQLGSEPCTKVLDDLCRQIWAYNPPATDEKMRMPEHVDGEMWAKNVRRVLDRVPRHSPTS